MLERRDLGGDRPVLVGRRAVLEIDEGDLAHVEARLGPQQGDEALTTLVKRYRLRADPNGNVEVLDTFWNFPGDAKQPDLVLRPDAGRPREVLEAFQLDSLQMIGSLRRAGKVVAVVQAERQLHQVRIGDHLGQDYGEVTAIGEDSMAIAERVQDSTGKWQLREVQLALRRSGAK